MRRYVLGPAAVLIGTIALDGCTTGSPAAAPAGPQQPASRLSGALPSLHALGESVLEAVREKDPKRFAAIRITKVEYAEFLYPEFPASDPAQNKPASFLWMLLDSTSRSGINDALGEYGRQDFELIEARAADGIETYESFRLHDRIVLKVRDRSTGKEGTLLFLGHAVEMDGGFKLLGLHS